MSTESPAEEKEPLSDKPVLFTQHTLLAYALANREIVNAVWPVMKPEYWDKQYRPAFDAITRHIDDFDRLPNPTMIEMATGERFTLPTDACDPKVAAWAVREFERWAKCRALHLFLGKAVDNHRHADNALLGEWVAEIEAIAQIACRRDPGHELHRDGLRLICEGDKSQVIPTRWRHLDLVMGGGMCCPGMFIVAGKSGTGKSIFLTNAAINFAEAGYDVVFITLEMSEKICAERFISIATEVPIRRIREDRLKIQAALDEHLACGAGRIFVKYLPIGSTIADIKGYVDNLVAVEEGIRPKVLVVDYMDLQRPKARIAMDNIHLRDKFTSEETYAFCVERNMMCFTASQLVKGSEQQDEYTQDSLAGGTPKISIADYVGALRHIYDKEILELHLLKARHGGHDARIPLSWPDGSLRIDDGPDDAFYEKNMRFDPNWRDRWKAKQQRKAAADSPYAGTSQDAVNKIKLHKREHFFI
jgi:hypothetical protein